MSNRFSCNINKNSVSFQAQWTSSDAFLGIDDVYVRGYNFFYCAEPLATSASIQNVKTNLREYYIKRIKIDCCLISQKTRDGYAMVYVLNVPDNYVPTKKLSNLRFSDLPSHTISQNVLYYGLFKVKSIDLWTSGGDVKIDIKKRFKLLPSHKLVFLYYLFSEDANPEPEGTIEVFFEVN